MSELETVDELGVLQKVISSLKTLDKDAQIRLLKSAVTFLNLTGLNLSNASATLSAAVASSSGQSFSDRPDISPKEFLLDKEPETDVEKVACLAYYLTHYRNIPEFKTLDLSKLNTEAAQVKFSNAAVAVDNATRSGYLVPASKGLKQLGALGEKYVRTLPDREAARAIRAKLKTRKQKRGKEGSESES